MFCAACLRDSALLDGQNLVLCDRHKGLDGIFCAWPAQYFVQAAKRFARVGQQKRCCWRSFLCGRCSHQQMQSCCFERRAKRWACEALVILELGTR